MRHFIKEKPDSGLICTLYIPIGNQLVDMLINGLNGMSFQRMINKLGMDDIYLLERECENKFPNYGKYIRILGVIG